MSKYNEKSKEYTMNYIKEKGLEEIRFRVPGEQKERYKAAAEKSGLKSMAQFFVTAADEKIERKMQRPPAARPKDHHQRHAGEDHHPLDTEQRHADGSSQIEQ